MNTSSRLLAALDPAHVLAARGMAVDGWQRDLLASEARQILLCCSRQAGKSTVVSALAYHTAAFRPGSLVLLLSPTLRQSGEIFRKVLDADRALGSPAGVTSATRVHLELGNGSRVVCLPGREATIRSFGGVALIVIDEAARVDDALYRSVRPMLAVSRGRLVALSTPFGRRGWFHDEWHSSNPWHRVRIPWTMCPRITPEFIAQERLSLGSAWVAQEYECEFTALTGLVYPDFAACLVETLPEVLPAALRGGIDFGWRDPFAAVWGARDSADVLWIVGERYLTQTRMDRHFQALRDLGESTWSADPSNPAAIAELRVAGLAVNPAPNAIQAGIAAVNARVQSGRLKVLRGACPNLVREAALYCYPSEGERPNAGENPIDADNHAMDALRYLVASLDRGFVARFRRQPEAQATRPVLADGTPWTRVG